VSRASMTLAAASASERLKTGALAGIPSETGSGAAARRTRLALCTRERATLALARAPLRLLRVLKAELEATSPSDPRTTLRSTRKVRRLTLVTCPAIRYLTRSFLATA
jgi:hypothetical protein